MAAIALIVVMWLPEHPLQTRREPQAQRSPSAADPESPDDPRTKEVVSR